MVSRRWCWLFVKDQHKYRKRLWNWIHLLHWRSSWALAEKLSKHYFPRSQKNCKVFFDNYFLSIPLMEGLQSKNILVCKIIWSNPKDFPKMWNDKNLKRGDFDYRKTPPGITACLISNYHDFQQSFVEKKNTSIFVIFLFF